MEAIGAIILAAGGSSRLGEPKQFLMYRGETLVRRAVHAAGGGGCAPVVVVAGAECGRIALELAEFDVCVAHHEQWRQGIGSSIRFGVERALSAAPALDALLMMVCDQPLATAGLVKTLVAARAETGKPIVACAYSGALGVPVLFDRALFPRLASLPDARGAKQLISESPGRVAGVAFREGAIDIDTPSDCMALR